MLSSPPSLSSSTSSYIYSDSEIKESYNSLFERSLTSDDEDIEEKSESNDDHLLDIWCREDSTDSNQSCDQSICGNNCEADQNGPTLDSGDHYIEVMSISSFTSSDWSLESVIEDSKSDVFDELKGFPQQIQKDPDINSFHSFCFPIQCEDTEPNRETLGISESMDKEVIDKDVDNEEYLVQSLAKQEGVPIEVIREWIAGLEYEDRPQTLTEAMPSNGNEIDINDFSERNGANDCHKRIDFDLWSTCSSISCWLSNAASGISEDDFLRRSSPKSTEESDNRVRDWIANIRWSQRNSTKLVVNNQ